MLSRVYEWYRIVSPQPSSDTVDKRTTSATDLVNAMDEADDLDLVLGCAQGVVAGFDSGFSQTSPAVQAIVGAIKGRDSAFPQDLTENAIELRSLAAIAIGELLVRNKDDAPDPSAKLVAAVLQSGLHLRPASKSRFVKQLLDELLGASQVRSAHAAQRSRQRSATIGQLVQNLPDAPTDPVAGMKAMTAALKTTAKELTRQAAIDREELDILWWIFSGSSATTGAAFSEMPIGAAALACGAELGGMCLLPPSANLDAMVRKTLSSGRTKSPPDRTLEKIAGEWDIPLQQLLVSGDSAATAQNYPVLFPLTWLSDRLLSSQGAPGWAAEFEKKTGLSALASYSHTTIAEQALRERIALREHQS